MLHWGSNNDNIEQASEYLGCVNLKAEVEKSSLQFYSLSQDIENLDLPITQRTQWDEGTFFCFHNQVKLLLC